MPDVITARLSEDISAPELSRMWESQRLETAAPEIVIESWGRFIVLRFHGSPRDRDHRKLKAQFELAVHRYRPDCMLDWVEAPAAAG